MDRQRTLGLNPDGTNFVPDRRDVIRYINLKLASLDHAPAGGAADSSLVSFASDLLAHYKEFARLLRNYLCPADERIQRFLNKTFAEVIDHKLIALPTKAMILDRHGLARELSIPIHADKFKNDILESYRTQQGVLHNPRSDRRTTAGVFHVADFGLPVPGDKLAVPIVTYARLLEAALRPPGNLLQLPFTGTEAKPVETWCTLLLRPTVAPEVPGLRPRKQMETRFFAPGGLVCNLDFVESIFGNAGDPYLPENDAGLDAEHWTGHTGCVILAPHIVGLNKKALGLPHVSEAGDRAKREGMCWTTEDEKYNNGQPFKIALRSKAGVMVTIISDNYFGYCKKEVKTQISFSANLSGLSEEEHAGGALAVTSFNHGDYFKLDQKVLDQGYTFVNAMTLLGDRVDVHVEGYAIDTQDPSIIYVHEAAEFDAKTQTVTLRKDGRTNTLKLLPDTVYVLPIGYKLRYERHPGAPSWRLVGTRAEGTVCHKPCTVSGGGKSEISKSIGESIVYGPIYVADFKKDLDIVEAIFTKDYSVRFRSPPPPAFANKPSRLVLSPQRSLGSVIKLLSHSDEYKPEYNAWLDSIPGHIRAIAFIIKRFYDAKWGADWRSHFSVDEVNGQPGHELKLNGRKLVGSYLRVGFSPDGNWRLYKLRQDFIAASKVQFEDDITASITVPTHDVVGGPLFIEAPSVKLLENTEARLFQRPDDAVHPGLDRQTEFDMSQEGLFASNYQPLTGGDAKAMVENVQQFEFFSEPMKTTLRDASLDRDSFLICSAKPRIVDGKPTKNPRYLQTRPDYQRPREATLAGISARLYRRVPMGEPVTFPVTSVLCGRRNNPGEPGIRPLAVYNPIHYQELPELFMDFICSLTGKSPSTTGVGSEGALTKGPFNAIRASADLNNALVSFILTGADGFCTASGYVGPNCRVDHDVSLLIPEIWCRMRPAEHTAKYLIEHKCLERMADFMHNGKPVLASRLGWRVNERFVAHFFGRVFDNPVAVFPPEMLRPEDQDIEQFVDGVNNIAEAQQRVARMYMEDGSVDDLCPPLQSLIHIMVDGQHNEMKIDDPKLRTMFTRSYLLESDWYQQRLKRQQRIDQLHLERHHAYIKTRRDHLGDDIDSCAMCDERMTWLEKELSRVKSPAYIEALTGTIGADAVAE